MQQGSTISILGCGWLGLPLAQRFIAEGYRVKGSTTTSAKLPRLAEAGIIPAVIHLQDLPDLEIIRDFITADVLIISIPPGLRSGKGAAYLQQMQYLAAALQQTATPHILFISSTSVYPDRNQVATEEDDADQDTMNHVLKQAESLFAALPGKTLTTVYLAGLAGGSRHPGRFLAGKTQVPNPAAPVNLVHQDDCVEILYQVVCQQQWDKRFNACSDAHPSREEYYTAAALSLGLTPPVFAPPGREDAFKIVSNEKVKQELNYQFKYPDPRLFF